MATFSPTQWEPSTYDNDLLSYAGRTLSVHAENDWSFNSTDNNTLRFEVRKGDRFTSNNWSDEPGVERAEIYDTARYSTSGDISVEYSFMIEPGAANTARWLTMGQLHSNTDGSPPIEIKLEGNDKMAIYGNYETSPGHLVYQKIYQDSADLVRGKWYTMKLDVRIDASGGGHADIWRDGQQIVDYSGKLGYVGQTATYWREGIYRSSAPETIAIDYRNLVIKTGSSVVHGPGPVPNNPSPKPVGLIKGTNGSETLNGTSGKESIYGYGGNDRLIGRDGDDFLNSSAGNDRLYGGTGNDRLYGGIGNDVLSGGTGKDAFVFNSRPTMLNRDRIVDFNVRDDMIHLENAVFTKLKAGKLSASNFRLGEKALDANDLVIYNSKTGILSYDADGNGAGTAVEVATLSNHVKLGYRDLYVI
jgi:Ca2+-binding RTX toxin-like protein